MFINVSTGNAHVLQCFFFPFFKQVMSRKNMNEKEDISLATKAVQASERLHHELKRGCRQHPQKCMKFTLSPGYLIHIEAKTMCKSYVDTRISYVFHLF